MVLLRRLYNWVLHWAETPYGAPALFILAFVESSIFPIPPDVLLLALSLSAPQRAFFFAGVCSVGSVLGGAAGYGLGYALWGGLSGYFYRYVPGFNEQAFLAVQELFARYDFWIVFTAGFTPVPYKLFTIGAGVFGANLPIFMLASLLSRSLRFFLLAWLIFKYGVAIRTFLNRYFNLLTCILTALLLIAFLLVKFCG